MTEHDSVESTVRLGVAFALAITVMLLGFVLWALTTAIGFVNTYCIVGILICLTLIIYWFVL